MILDILNDLGMNLYSIIVTVLTLILGGGWFIHYKAKKRIEDASAGLKELELKESSFEYYLKRICDLEKQLMDEDKIIENLKKQIQYEKDKRG